MAPDTFHPCPRCGLRFAHRTELANHVAVDHPPEAVDDLPSRAPAHDLVTVALDPTHPPSAALQIASTFARQGDFLVEVVTAPAPGLSSGPFLTARQREVVESGAGAARPRSLSGRPADAIVAHAGGGHTRLLCVGTRARGALAERTLGSVSAEVLRRSPVPVLLVGPNAHPGRPIRRLLVGVDGSLLADAALAIAATLAGRLGADLEMVEVIAPGDMAPDVPETAELRRAATRLPFPARDYDVLHGTDPARAIAERAGMDGDTIVVVGTHGRTGLDRLVLGSVAHGLARRCAGPVLVVPRTAVPGLATSSKEPAVSAHRDGALR